MLAAGEAVMVDAYNGRIDAANTRTRRTSRSSGRTISTIDSWVIMKGPQQGRCPKFLVFFNDPNYQKNLPTKIAYA
jgi:spermidine/putrescine-binding protein